MVEEFTRAPMAGPQEPKQATGRGGGGGRGSRAEWLLQLLWGCGGGHKRILWPTSRPESFQPIITYVLFWHVITSVLEMLMKNVFRDVLPPMDRTS